MTSIGLSVAKCPGEASGLVSAQEDTEEVGVRWGGGEVGRDEVGRE